MILDKTTTLDSIFSFDVVLWLVWTEPVQFIFLLSVCLLMWPLETLFSFFKIIDPASNGPWCAFITQPVIKWRLYSNTLSNPSILSMWICMCVGEYSNFRICFPLGPLVFPLHVPMASCSVRDKRMKGPCLVSSVHVHSHAHEHSFPSPRVCGFLLRFYLFHPSVLVEYLVSLSFHCLPQPGLQPQGSRGFVSVTKLASVYSHVQECVLLSVSNVVIPL